MLVCRVLCSACHCSSPSFPLTCPGPNLSMPQVFHFWNNPQGSCEEGDGILNEFIILIIIITNVIFLVQYSSHSRRKKIYFSGSASLRPLTCCAFHSGLHLFCFLGPATFYFPTRLYRLPRGEDYFIKICVLKCLF